MTEALPAPLVPAEVDLRDFQYMELDVRVLRDSRFVSEVKPEAFRAGVMLWCAAWHQLPSGSVPDNDIELAKLAGYGFAVREWKKVRAQALTKFVRCSDGRLYHEEVSSKALAAWRSRLEHFYERAKDRLRKANKARSLETPPRPPLPELTFEQWNERRITGAVPMEKAEAFAGIPPNSAEQFPGIPPENALKGEGEGEGEGTEREKERRKEEKKHAQAAPPAQRAPDSDPPPEANGHSPTQAGSVCKAMRKAGLQETNPGDPRLLALLAQGATEAEFVGLAIEATEKRIKRPWGWVLTVLPERRAEAAAITLANPVARPNEPSGRLPEYVAPKQFTPEEQAASDAARIAAMKRLGRVAS